MALAPPPPPPRPERLERLRSGPLDVLVVGGGITGVGIAHDLALRGLRAAVVEKHDWGAGTSSTSSRLIHGGLRYLEQLELGLVRHSCIERARLLDNAAGLVWPERFVFPLHRGGPVGRLRLGCGLALYSLVSLPRPLGLPRLVGRGRVAELLPGVRAEGLLGGGTYLDGSTDDARLTLAVALTAAAAGAIALSRCEVTGLEQGRSGVAAELLDRETGERFEVRAAVVVLAGGPLTDRLRRLAGLPGGWVAPTRGAHVLVPRERLPTDGAFIFTSAVDGRTLFLIPWPRFTVIGTTDLDDEPREQVHATSDEVDYLLASANALVPAAALARTDVVSSWAGLRPLLAATGRDPSARSREERIESSGRVTTIAGGKLTAFRSMAESLGARVAAELGRGDPRTSSPTRRVRLRGALPHRVGRPSWSALGPDGRPVVVGSSLDDAWRQRYAGLEPAVRAALDPAADEALDAVTRLGEVDWAVGQEDCLGVVDFAFRRTDLGYGTPGEVRAVAPRLLARLAERLGWDAERTARERAELDRALEGAQAWRAGKSARVGGVGSEARENGSGDDPRSGR